LVYSQANVQPRDPLRRNLAGQAQNRDDCMMETARLIFRNYSVAALVAVCGCAYGVPAASVEQAKQVKILVEHVSPATQKRTRVFQRVDSTAVSYLSGMTIDADGAPNAYHPDGQSGLDSLENAGNGGEWWALVLGENGQPVIQQSGQYSGYYVSMTWLHREDDGFSKYDPNYWVDSRLVPYIAIPKTVWRAAGVNRGDLAFVYNEKTGKASYAIVADWGTENTLGEGSIALAEALGIDSDPRYGGQDDRVDYVVFPATAGKPRWPQKLDAMKRRAERLFQQWGGLDELARLRSVANGENTN
jgi:hypothetical protein